MVISPGVHGRGGKAEIKVEAEVEGRGEIMVNGKWLMVNEKTLFYPWLSTSNVFLSSVICLLSSDF